MADHRHDIRTDRTKRREPIRITDEYGQAAVRVPLDNNGRRYALADAAEYDRLVAEGIGGAWYVNGDGQGREYVRTAVNGAAGKQIMVARALLRLGRGEVVRFHNGNRLDLRRRNLQATRGKAKRNDRMVALMGRHKLAEPPHVADTCQSMRGPANAGPISPPVLANAQ